MGIDIFPDVTSLKCVPVTTILSSHMMGMVALEIEMPGAKLRSTCYDKIILVL